MLIFLILSGTLVTVVKEFARSYNLLDAEVGYVEVVAKTANKGLFQPPAHYVKVDINDKNPNDVYDGVLNRVTTFQMKNLEIGDQIKGFIISDNHFMTLYDIIFDSIIFVLGVIILILFILAALIGIIGVFVKEERPKKSKLPPKKKRWKKRKVKEEKKSFSIGAAFLIAFFVITGFLSFTFMINTFHKAVPIFQTKTDAVIVDKYSEREWLAFRGLHALSEHTADPLFQLTLLYKDENGVERRAIKEVTHHTFYKYEVNDAILISYRDANPFDIFIRESTLLDFIDATKYWQFIIYSSISTAAILTGILSLRNFLKHRMGRS